MGLKTKFALALAAAYGVLWLAIAALAYPVWASLKPEEQAQVARILAAHLELAIFVGLLLLAVLGILLHELFMPYLEVPRRLSEAIEVISAANPAHRAKVAGPAELEQLARRVNALADRYQKETIEVDSRVAEATAGVERQKNRLAALMSQLSECVVVCNRDGLILLYNERARLLLDRGAAGATPAAGRVGLGRSLFGLLDRNLIAHALEQVQGRLGRGEAAPVTSFVATTPSDQLVRVQLAPVVERIGAREISGFVLTLSDIQASIEAGTRVEALLQGLTEGTRAALASIRAAVETMMAYPKMEPPEREQFTCIVREEAERLTARLEETVAAYAGQLKLRWHLEPMLGADLVTMLRHALQRDEGLDAAAVTAEETIWLQVDSFALVQLFRYLARRLRDECGVGSVELRLGLVERHTQLDLAWSGRALDVETALAWEIEPLSAGGIPSPLTLRDIVARHGGEFWYRANDARQRAHFRLMLPLAEAARAQIVLAPTEERPEYYDFDLFERAAPDAALDERPLAELSYTVFDTETTGLEPSAGDEIISIGAARIVNGRLLRHETFEQLVDPRRPLSRKSIEIHGIEQAMLRGQPGIEEVLPAFHRFCEATVLVAHNAAFDMRFLQLKETRTGLRFDQPVLDTLLLSAVLHPNLNAHRLEAIAERLGVNLIGRHNALGDAFATGEVFLKMLPLLAREGIVTLRQAREASQKSYYARIRY
ncbi:MAG: exonuclease domain-containing protein [Solimonas sp.]